MDEPIRVRIITVGDVRSGKSATIKKYCEPNRFVSNHIPTVGVDYGVKSTKKIMNDGSGNGSSTEIKIDFFDLSGEKTVHKRYISMTHKMIKLSYLQYNQLHR